MRPFAPLLLVSALAAQHAVFPPAYATIEGNAADRLWSSAATMRHLEVHASTVGRPIASASRLKLRRDAFHGGGTPRTVRLELFLGLGSYRQNQPAPEIAFADLYEPGTRVQVIHDQTISFPDWSVVPGAGPAAFDLVLLFDRTFSYAGIEPLVWETLMHATSHATPLAVDAVENSGAYAPAAREPLGSGCALTLLGVPGFEAMADFARIGFGVAGTTPSAPCFLLLGVADPNLQVTGLCASLRSSADVILPLGVANGEGRIATVYEEVPYSSGFQGASLYTQAIGLAGATPADLQLSNAFRYVLPPPGTRHAARANQAHALSAAATTASEWSSTRGCVIAIE